MSSEKIIKERYANCVTLDEYIFITNEVDLKELEMKPELRSFLRSTFVACDEETAFKPDRKGTSFDTRNMEEIVRTVIEKSLAKDEAKNNVFMYGLTRLYRKSLGQVDFGCEDPNSMVNYVKNSWLFEELRCLIGNDLFMHLIGKLSIFVAKSKHVYMQVAGLPINDASKSKVKAPAVARTTDETAKSKKRTHEMSKPNKEIMSRSICNAVGKDKRRCFPQDHFMEKTPGNMDGARSLVKEIFCKTDRCHVHKMLKSALPKFLTFLRKHKSCPFLSFLKKFCPADVSNFDTTGKLEEVPHYQVKQFITAVINRNVPLKLMGSKHNRGAFLKTMKRYISLRKKENISLREVMIGIRIKDFDIITKPREKVSLTEREKQQSLLSKFFLWLVNCYVAPLLRNSFTITESVSRRNYLDYYRKRVWADAQEIALSEMETSTLSRLSEADVVLMSAESLGCSPLRFIPKVRGLRPVTNMAAKIIPPDENIFPKKPRSVNEKLSTAQSVLAFERERCEDVVGGGVFGFGEIYGKLKPFAERHRDENRPLYFVKLDFAKCYDSMNQDKMMEILEEVLQEDDYNIRKYCVMKMNPNKQAMFFHSQQAAPIEDSRDFSHYIDGEVARKRLKNAVVIDKVKYDNVERDDVMKDLCEHIKSNIVEVSSQKYIQKCGVAQGSKIAPILCHLYLGHIERSKFPDILSDQDSLLMRWIDDPLLLTYNLEQAARYLNTMLQQDLVYNTQVNISKCLVNFDAVTPAGEKVSKLSADEEWLAWCSLLINRKTLEVKCDYSRTRDCRAMRDSLSFDMTETPGQKIFENLKFALLTKCHHLFLDTELNSRQTVLANVYESFQYLASRFDAFACELPTDKQVRHNPQFFFKGLGNIVKTYYTLTGQLLNVRNGVREDTACGLFYKAFLELMERKPTRYGALKKLIKCELRRFLIVSF